MRISQMALSMKPGVRHAMHGAVLSLLLCTPALCQTQSQGQGQGPATLPPVARTADLSGPRFGFTFLPEGVIQKLAEREIQVGPNISQFGWQFEKVFYARGSGVTMVTEWVALIGGLEQDRRAAQPQLDGGRADERRRGVRHRPERHAGRYRAGPGGRHDVSRRPAQRAAECRDRAVEVRRAHQRAFRLQPAAAIMEWRTAPTAESATKSRTTRDAFALRDFRVFVASSAVQRTSKNNRQAVVSSRSGARVSFLAGFSIRRQ